jgi:hypothetical protein
MDGGEQLLDFSSFISLICPYCTPQSVPSGVLLYKIRIAWTRKNMLQNAHNGSDCTMTR